MTQEELQAIRDKENKTADEIVLLAYIDVLLTTNAALLKVITDTADWAKEYAQSK
jgi:hypothetical protein